MQGYGLSQASGIVLDGDILQRNLAALNLQGEGAEGANLLGFALGSQWGDVSTDIGMIVPCDNGLVAVLTTYLDVGKPLRDNEFLLVGAFFYEDNLMILHEGATHLDSVSNVTKLARSIARHEQGVRIVITLSLCAHHSQEGANDAD